MQQLLRRLQQQCALQKRQQVEKAGLLQQRELPAAQGPDLKRIARARLRLRQRLWMGLRRLLLGRRLSSHRQGIGRRQACW
jgi:hypothetical protein